MILLCGSQSFSTTQSAWQVTPSLGQTRALGWATRIGNFYSFSKHGLATLYSSEKLLKLFPYVLRNRCCGVWRTPTSFLRKWITLADLHVSALLSKGEVRLRETRFKLIVNTLIINPNHRISSEANVRFLNPQIPFRVLYKTDKDSL